MVKFEKKVFFGWGKIYGYGLIQMYVSDKLTGQGGGRHTYISHIILFYSKQSKWIHITIQTYTAKTTISSKNY